MAGRHVQRIKAFSNIKHKLEASSLYKNHSIAKLATFIGCSRRWSCGNILLVSSVPMELVGDATSAKSGPAEAALHPHLAVYFARVRTSYPV